MTGPDHQWSLSNPGPDTLFLWLEPWAEEVAVPARSTVAMRPSGGCTPGKVEWGADHLVLWAEAPTVEVFVDGILQDTGSARIAVPEGLTKDMLGILFAGQPAARLGGAHAGTDRRISLGERVKRRLRR